MSHTAAAALTALNFCDARLLRLMQQFGYVRFANARLSKQSALAGAVRNVRVMNLVEQAGIDTDWPPQRSSRIY